jgi:opacity protein-like surface antigen
LPLVRKASGPVDFRTVAAQARWHFGCTDPDEKETTDVMRKSIVSTAALALVVALPGSAAAQGSAGTGVCPPGSWFCAQDSQEQAAPAGKPVKPSLDPLPDPEDDSAPAPPVRKPPRYEPGTEGAPPVVVYQPPPPVVVVRPAEPPPPYDYAPPQHAGYRQAPEWALNLHLEGASIGHGANDASMGGGGLGLRLRPTRYFGIETDLDFLGGTDYQGDHRNETAFTVNGLLFVNPRSRAQLYLLAGFGGSGAHVTSGSIDQHYGYFGGQIGAGLELRLSRNFALDIDVRGFIRGRTDQLSQSQPEFTSTDGRSTNTSGGGLLTGGMTIYF